MDKLAAINKMLKMVGTRKVTSLTVLHPDVTDAIEELDLRTESLLKRGWWFNRRNTVTLTPNSVGEIIFGLEVLRFEINDVRNKTDYGSLAKHGSRLYNADTNSYTFDYDVELDLFINMDWEHLPDSAQYYILYRAGAEFVRDKIEDSAKEMQLKSDAAEQLEDLHAEEIRTEKVNMFENPAAKALRQGRRPFFNGTVGRY